MNVTKSTVETVATAGKEERTDTAAFEKVQRVKIKLRNVHDTPDELSSETTNVEVNEQFVNVAITTDVGTTTTASEKVLKLTATEGVLRTTGMAHAT